MAERKSAQKLVDECLKILREETNEGTQKWIKDSKITSLNLRNFKAQEVVSLTNYFMQKMLINPEKQAHQLLHLLVQYQKKSSNKCHEYSRLIKHFSQWDYQFQYIYELAQDKRVKQLGLYLRVREAVIHCQLNKGRKELLSGVWGQIEQWAALANGIFRQREEADVIDEFTTVVKNHYVQVKKSQSQKINGAQFLRICQIIDEGNKQVSPTMKKSKSAAKVPKETDQVARIFQDAALNGLNTQDKELIRVLSYQDKNVARMLEEKHTKMVNLIGEQVYALRRDINHEKERYMDVVEQKNALLRLIQKLKESTLRYVLNRNQATQFEVLQQLSSYNKKYSPKSTDVTQTIDVINNRRLIEIIEKEEMQQDQQ